MIFDSADGKSLLARMEGGPAEPVTLSDQQIDVVINTAIVGAIKRLPGASLSCDVEKTFDGWTLKIRKQVIEL